MLSSTFDGLGSAGKVLWAILRAGYFKIHGDEFWKWFTDDAVSTYQDGVTVICRCFWFWLALTVVLTITNIMWWQSTGFFSVLSLITVIISAFIMIWFTPIVMLGVLLKSAVSPEAPKDMADLGPWIVLQHGDLVVRFKNEVTRWMRVIKWILLGELVIFMYLQIFPIWNNKAAIPLLINAVVAVLILSRLQSGEARWMKESTIRNILNTAMLLIIVLCGLSFFFRETFEQMRHYLSLLDETFSLKQWLPLSFLLTLTLVAFQVKYMRVFELPLIILSYLYAGSMGIELVVLSNDIPRFGAEVVGGIGLTGILIVIGYLLPEGGGRGKRVVRGFALASIIIIPGMIGWFGTTQADRIYDHRIGVYSPDSSRVATDGSPLPLIKVCVNFECPKYLEAFRDAKTKDVFHDICGDSLVWIDSLTPEQLEEFRKTKNYRDGVKIGLDMKSLATGTGDHYPSMKLQLPEKGDTP
ncbi:MAG: hypothetical protein ABII24_03065 [bacterium]